MLGNLARAVLRADLGSLEFGEVGDSKTITAGSAAELASLRPVVIPRRRVHDQHLLCFRSAIINTVIFIRPTP